jgi:phage tail-like protein
MRSEDPYRTFRFLVELESLVQGGFSQISGLERETKVDSFHEGGLNTHEIKRVSGTTWPNLVLKRGLADRALWDWHEAVIQRTLTGNVKAERKDIRIVVLDAEGNKGWGWVCQRALPVKWSGGELDATTNQVAVETLELAHHGLRREA